MAKPVIVYLGERVICSDTLEEHLKHLQQVLSTLEKHQLYAKPSKCIFAATTIELCGRIVGNGQVNPAQDKLKVIKDLPVPKTVHHVRKFLGLAWYYRRFVKSFAKIACPLFELLKEGDAELRKRKHRLIRWTAACREAFDSLKERLTSAPILTQPDVRKTFSIESDASERAIGCSLLQQDKQGKWHPVAYDDRKLSAAELNYPNHGKELLAIEHALRTW
jgi:hypothetical protein